MTASSLVRSRDRRALQIGALAVAVLLLVRSLPTIRDGLSRWVNDAQLLEDRLTYARRAIVGLPAMRDALVERARRLREADGALLHAGTPARVAADLSALVSTAARNAGLDLLSASATRDSSTSTVLLRSEVRIEAQGDISGVMQFLLLLELAPGLLEVRELSLSQPEPAAARNRPEALRASLVVEGVARRAVPDSARTGRPR